MPRITALRTIRITERPNLIWVEVETDEGLTGLGEIVSRRAEAAEAVLHEQVAPWLIGRDPRADRGGLPPSDDAVSRLRQRRRRSARRQRH